MQTKVGQASRLPLTPQTAVSRFSAILILLLGLVLLPPLSFSAKPDPRAKIPPAPSQGSLTPSGKFTPPPPAGATNEASPQTPAEAEALLAKSLNVKQTGPNTYRIGPVEFDKLQRFVAIPAKVAIRTQIVEYALVTEKGKAYESMFTTEATPIDVHLAFLLLGIPATPVAGEFRQAAPVPETNAVKIEAQWEAGGKQQQASLAQLVCLAASASEKDPPSLAVDKWLYNGSVFDQGGFAAQREGSIISLIRDTAALVNNPAADRDNDNIHLPRASLLPAQGTPVRVVLRLPRPPTAPATPPPPWASPITPLSTNAY